MFFFYLRSAIELKLYSWGNVLLSGSQHDLSRQMRATRKLAKCATMVRRNQDKSSACTLYSMCYGAVRLPSTTLQDGGFCEYQPSAIIAVSCTLVSCHFGNMNGQDDRNPFI